MLSLCSEVTHAFHILYFNTCKTLFLCFVHLFRVQSKSRKWRCQSTIRKVGTSYKYRYKYCIIKALLTIRELHTVCPWSEFQNQLSFSHYQFRARKPCHSPYFTIALLLRFSVLLSWFQPIFVLFVAISAIPMSLFQGHVLVRILPEQGPIQTTSSPPSFLRGDFHARSRFARSTIPEKKWGTTRSLGPIIIWIINNKTNMLTCSYINSMFSFEHCIICFFLQRSHVLIYLGTLFISKIYEA